ncbi:MAG: hypothetical protein ABJB40_04650 [Acidobacteriota bacterium]
MLKIIYFALMILIVSVGSCFAQNSNDSWLRLITGEGYFIDVDKTSLTLKNEGIINAKFRTSFGSPETAVRRPALKSQARIDSIDFLISTHSYRIVESKLLGPSGQIISHKTNLEWKPRTASARLFFSAASKLAPFGSWKVLSYRYVSGEGPGKDDPEEIKSLVGNTVSLRLENLFIGRSNCPDASFDFKSVSDKDLEHYGFSLSDIGIKSDAVTIMSASCKSNPGYPQRTLIFLNSTTKATILWNGVLFEIERLPNEFF